MKTTCWNKFLLLFFVSLFTHLPGITNPLLDYHGWAQTLRASQARNFYAGGMNLFKPEYDYFQEDHDKSPQFPLYSYVAALLYKIFGLHDFLGRVLSAFFAGLSAWLLYLLALRFMDERAALAGALAFCVIPIRIYFMRAFMPEAMAIACLLAGFYFYLKWMDSRVRSDVCRSGPIEASDRGDDDSRQRRIAGILCLLFLSLVPLLKIAYLWLLAVPVADAINRDRHQFSAENWCLSLFIAVLFILLPAAGWYFYANQGGDSVSFYRQILAEMSVVKAWGDPGFWATHFISRFPELLTTYAGLLFFFLGLSKAWREKIRFPLVWLACTVLYIALCGEYGRIHQYVSLPFAPVNAIFIGMGIVVLWDKWRDKKLLALWTLLVLSMPVHAALRIRHWYALDPLWMPKAREMVAQLSRPEDLFFVASQNQPFYLYHIGRKGWAVHLEGEGTEIFGRALGQGASFLFVPLRETGSHWASLRRDFERRFPLIHKDQDFEIFDLRRAGIRP